MEKLQAKIQAFSNKPTSVQVYTIQGRQYRVVSHYVGEKDVDTTLLDLAKRNAYAKVIKKLHKAGKNLQSSLKKL